MSSFMTPHFVCIASGWVRVDPEFLIHSEHKQAEATETAMPTIKCLVKALFAPETTYRPASSKTRWLVTARGPPYPAFYFLVVLLHRGSWSSEQFLYLECSARTR